MKQTVKKSDYEVYTFNIPLSLRGKKRVSFITKELEKQHPCFSQQCCFDSKTKLRKGKFLSIVAVMDKVKLLEYRGKSKSGISLEGIKKIKFFNEERKPYVLIVALLLFILLGAISFLFGNAKKNETVVQKTNVNLIDEMGVEKFPVNPFELLEKVFIRISESKGFVKKLSYTKDAFALDDMNGCISMEIKKVFPENISLVSSDVEGKIVQTFSPISYDMNDPYFNLDFSFAADGYEIKETVDFDLMAELRKELKETGKVLSENSGNGSFQISVKYESLYDFFIKSASKIEELNLGIKKMEITSGGDCLNIFLSVYKTDSINKKNEIFVLADFWNLFCEKTSYEKNTDINRKEEVFENGISEKNKEEVGMNKNLLKEKIGSVITKNGKTISFYRSLDGHIRGVEE